MLKSVSSVLCLTTFAFSFAAAAPLELVEGTAAPVFSFSQGSVVGNSTSGVDSFLGIPFAEPPVGNLRFAAPVTSTKQLNNFDASQFGANCGQMGLFDGFAGNPIFDTLANDLVGTLEKLPLLSTLTASNQAENCLFVNVQRPSGTAANAGLPVMLWIFGGGFLFRGSSTYDATSLVTRSMTMNTPIIFASMNCRVASFGFLGGQEVTADSTTSVNAGFQDQR